MATKSTVTEISEAPQQGANIEVFLSTDGKHTVHITSPLRDAEDLELVFDNAADLYDRIVEKYGLKPAPAPRGQASGGGSGGRSFGGRPAGGGSRPEPDIEPFCADCGSEIKGFTDRDGKDVSGKVIAAARKRKNGRVTCGKDGCKNEF